MGRLIKAAGAAACFIGAAAVTGAAIEAFASKDQDGSVYDRFGKRACDIAVGLAALPVVGAATAACGAAIKREDGGPVFYKQVRLTKDNKTFKIINLRSIQPLVN